MQRHLWSRVLSACLIGSAITAWVLVAVVSPVVPSAGAAVPSHSLTGSKTISNAALKGDRLISIHVKIDDSKRDGTRTPSSVGKLPLGCDPAFSKLVRQENLPTRCITAIDTSIKLAQASIASPMLD